MPTAEVSAEDRFRLQHILTAARDAVEIAGGRTADEVEREMMRWRALAHCFMEIGEAAARVSPPLKERLPGVPWRQIVGMRNLLVHVYWGVQIAVLHKTTRNDLPLLIPILTDALASPPSRNR